MANCKNESMERWEARYSVVFERYGLVMDSGGAGEYRGGLGTERRLRVTRPVAVSKGGEKPGTFPAIVDQIPRGGILNGREHARQRRQAGWKVQLHFAGGASSDESSASPHSRDGGRRADGALTAMSRDFARLYAQEGRPSIAPERLLRALVLQVLSSLRSERLLVEELDYNLLYRWFVGMSADEPVWKRSTFSKNRDRLMVGDIGRKFFTRVLAQAKVAGLTSDEHFSVDDTLIDAWASQKRFRRKDGSDDDNPDSMGRNSGCNLQGERRTNDIHASSTDPEARMYRKSNAHPAQLCYAGHVLMENRNGLVVALLRTTARQWQNAQGRNHRLHALAVRSSSMPWRTLRPHGESTVLNTVAVSAVADRHRVPPWGLRGGSQVHVVLSASSGMGKNSRQHRLEQSRIAN